MKDGRHFHIHAKSTTGYEVCMGDHAHSLSEASDRARKLQAETPNTISLIYVISLPYCLYGPDDQYKIGTYCVGRGERYDAE